MTTLLFILCSLAQENPPPGLKYYYPVPAANPPKVVEVDVCAYGGTPGGVTATIQAARMGKTAALVVFGRHVGGMTSGGLTATDIGNRAAIGGLAEEFYIRMGQVSGFSPGRAEGVFRAMLQDAKVPVYYERRLKSLRKSGMRITEIEMENGDVFRAKMFVDTTYEGDLLAMAGVPFHVGREANATYNETWNGKQFRDAHNFLKPVDPYRIEGDSTSGLLPTISPDAPGKTGEGDACVQAYCFRMYLINGTTRVSWPMPSTYDATRYELLARYLKVYPHIPFQLKYGDSNNTGGFSTDHIGANFGWPEGDYATRERIFQDHVAYQQGLLWFFTHDARVPVDLRDKVIAWGLHPDEFKDSENWPHQLYIREGRRMVSGYVMTEHNCASRISVEDSVGLASYTMDSHNCRRIVLNGKVRNEGDVQVGVAKPFPIAYRSIVPRESDCANLFVPVCLSASHIAYGSIRMEPVFMGLGQSAGTAAAMAIDAGVPVQKVDYVTLHDRLLADKHILFWGTDPTPAPTPAPAPIPSAAASGGNGGGDSRCGCGTTAQSAPGLLGVALLLTAASLGALRRRSASPRTRTFPALDDTASNRPYGFRRSR